MNKCLFIEASMIISNYSKTELWGPAQNNRLAGPWALGPSEDQCVRGDIVAQAILI